MSQKQDKQRIYNSKEWKIVRDAQLNRQPLCERCLDKGLIVSARCVHHIIPIETATDWSYMCELAYRQSNLMSLCYQCHSDIHKALNSRTREGHERASRAALDRWVARNEAKAKANTYGIKADAYLRSIEAEAKAQAKDGSDG